MPPVDALPSCGFLENFLRVAFVDRLPRIEEHLAAFDHAFVLAPLGVFIAREGVAHWGTHRNVSDSGVDVRCEPWAMLASREMS